MSQLTKYEVITDSESAVGFRLAGIDTYVADNIEKAEKLLQDRINSGETGLLLINQHLMDHFSDSFQRKLDKISLPLIIPIPISQTWWKEEPADDYIFSLIRRAIGYQMKIKKA